MLYIKCLDKVTVEPAFILSTICFISHYFSLPQLLVLKICTRRYDDNICSDMARYHDIQNEVQAESALWMMIIGLSSALPSVVVILVIGPLSDITGRKIFLVCVPGVLALHSISLLLNSHFMFLHMAYLIPGFLFPVLIGNFQGIVLLCYAYIAAITSQGRERTMRMALIGGSLTISIALAGMLSGFIIDQYGYPTLYVVTFILCVINFVYTTIFLPPETAEDLAKITPDENVGYQAEEKRCPHQATNYENVEGKDFEIIKEETSTESRLDKDGKGRQKYPGLLKCIYDSLSILTEPSQRILRCLLVLTFGFTVLAIIGEINVMILFLKHTPFNFTSFQVGLFMGAAQILRGFGGVLIPQLILRMCPVSDFVLASIGFVSKIVTDIWMAFSVNERMLMFALFIGIGGALPSICLRAAISKTVLDRRFGTVLCTLGAVNEVFIALSDILANNIYRYTVSWFPGFQFLVSASFCTVGLCIVTFVQCRGYAFDGNNERIPLLDTEGEIIKE